MILVKINSLQNPHFEAMISTATLLTLSFIKEKHQKMCPNSLALHGLFDPDCFRKIPKRLGLLLQSLTQMIFQLQVR